MIHQLGYAGHAVIDAHVVYGTAVGAGVAQQGVGAALDGQ